MIDKPHPLQIEFITDDNPLYVLPFFEELLANYAAELNISRISLCRPMGKRSRRDLLRQLVALYGAVGSLRLFSRLACARLLSVLPRKRGAARYFSLSQLAKAYGIECEKIANPNSAEFRTGLTARKPDLLASVACPYILKAPVLAIPAQGCINIHHAPLPRYKGMMPTFWQLFHGEKSVGVTIHYMTEAIDDGGILLQEQLPVEQHESLDRLITRAKRHGAHAMAKVFRDITAGTQNPVALDNERCSYFTFPTTAEMHAFRKRGLRAI